MEMFIMYISKTSAEVNCSLSIGFKEDSISLLVCKSDVGFIGKTKSVVWI